MFRNWFLYTTFKTQVLKIMGLLEDSGNLEDLICALSLETCIGDYKLLNERPVML